LEKETTVQYAMAPYYPPAHNPPLTRAAKVWLAIGAVVVVGAGTFLLWPKPAKAEVLPPLPPLPGPTPKNNGRPSGHPQPYGAACYPAPGGQSAYDKAFWDAGGTAVARERVLEVFQRFGYSTPVGRDTMNDPGPDADLGGGDDIPNDEVRRFQREYNAVSRSGVFLPKTTMGGLDEDGFVGPCTLNGMRLIDENLGDRFWPDIVAEAAG